MSSFNDTPYDPQSSADPEHGFEPINLNKPEQPPASPYGIPAGYATPAPYTPNQPQETNPLAIAALVSGIVSVVLAIFVFISSPLAIIFGHVALAQIKRTGQAGRGLAIAGLLLGYITLAFAIIAFAIFLIVFAVAGTDSHCITTSAGAYHCAYNGGDTYSYNS